MITGIIIGLLLPKLGIWGIHFYCYLKRRKGMNRQTHATLSVVLMLTLLTGCMGCASPPKRIHIGSYTNTPIVGVPLDTATHAWAMTKCDISDRPVIIVASYIPDSELYYVIEHEKHHVTQIEREDIGCHAFNVKYSENEDFRFEMEAEAYCVGFMSRVMLGKMEAKDNYPYLVMHMTSLFPERKFADIWDSMPCIPRREDGQGNAPPSRDPRPPDEELGATARGRPDPLSDWLRDIPRN